MRRLQQIICVLFVISCAVAGLYLVKSRMVEDHTPPVIRSEQDELTVSVKDSDAVLLQGLTAEDNRDGDLTEQIRVSSMSHFIEKGKRTISYIVFDHANQPATYDRTLIYKDYESPKIYLSEPLIMDLNELYNANFLEYVTAEDCLDGNLTNMIHSTTGYTFYDSQLGKKELTYYVSNSAGDTTTIAVEVEAVDWSAAKQSRKLYPALKEYIAYTKKGKKIDAKDYITGLFGRNVTYDFERDGEYLDFNEDDITIKSKVDYDKAGVYTIEYSYTSEDDIKGVTTLYVVVE